MGIIEAVRAALFGSPAVDGFKPDRTLLLNALSDVVTAISALGVNPTVFKETKALLDADLHHNADTIALVYGDTTSGHPEYNDYYIKLGANNAGSWDPLGLIITPALSASVAAVVAAYADIDTNIALAESWAENPEDSPVETGKYSAKHWAAKAEADRLLAEAWAENPEDTPVTSGHFSAFHWAEKTEAAAAAALTDINNAKVDAVDAITAGNDAFEAMLGDIGTATVAEVADDIAAKAAQTASNTTLALSSASSSSSNKAAAIAAEVAAEAARDEAALMAAAVVFDTYAAAAAAATISDGARVIIYIDETKNGALSVYKKTGSTLTYLRELPARKIYDPHSPIGRLENAISIPEGLEQLGIAPRRITVASGTLIYNVKTMDFAPAVHVFYADSGTTTYVNLDGLEDGREYVFVAAGTYGGLVSFSIGSQNYLEGDGISPNVTSTRNFYLRSGDRATIIKFSTNYLFNLDALSFEATDSNGGWVKRVSTGKYEVFFVRPETSTISAGAESSSNSIPTGFTLTGAKVMSVAYGQRVDGADNSVLHLPKINKLGQNWTGSTYAVGQFAIKNPDASNIIQHPVHVHFVNVDLATLPANVVYARNMFWAGQSYGREGINLGGGLAYFMDCIARVSASNPTQVQAAIGGSPTIAAGQVWNRVNLCVDGSAVLNANKGSVNNYWLNDDLTDGPLLTTAKATIAATTGSHGVLQISMIEQDGPYITDQTKADALTAGFLKLILELRTAIKPSAPTDLPVWIDLIGPRYESNELAEYRARDLMIDIIDADPKLYRGASKYALHLDTTTHPSADYTGYAQMFAQVGRKIQQWLIDQTDVHGPTIGTTTRSGNNVTMTINVPSGKTLVSNISEPEFFGFWDSAGNRIPVNYFSWSGNNLTAHMSATPVTMRYPARQINNKRCNPLNIIRLTDPTDPLFTGELGLFLEEIKTTTLA